MYQTKWQGTLLWDFEDTFIWYVKQCYRMTHPVMQKFSFFQLLMPSLKLPTYYYHKLNNSWKKSCCSGEDLYYKHQVSLSPYLVIVYWQRERQFSKHLLDKLDLNIQLLCIWNCKHYDQLAINQKHHIKTTNCLEWLLILLIFFF